MFAFSQIRISQRVRVCELSSSRSKHRWHTIDEEASYHSQSHAQTLWSMTSAEDCTISRWRTQRNTMFYTLHDLSWKMNISFWSWVKGVDKSSMDVLMVRVELRMLTHADLPIGSYSQWSEDQVIWEGLREFDGKKSRGAEFISPKLNLSSPYQRSSNQSRRRIPQITETSLNLGQDRTCP